MKKFKLLILLSSAVMLVPSLSFGMLPEPFEEFDSKDFCIKYEKEKGAFVVRNKSGELIQEVKNLKKFGYDEFEYFQKQDNKKDEKSEECICNKHIFLERLEEDNSFVDVVDLINKKCILCMSFVKMFHRPDRYRSWYDKGGKIKKNKSDDYSKQYMECRKNDDNEKVVNFCFENFLKKSPDGSYLDPDDNSTLGNLLSLKCKIGDNVFDVSNELLDSSDKQQDRTIDDIDHIGLSKEAVLVNFNGNCVKIYESKKDNDGKAKLEKRHMFRSSGLFSVIENGYFDLIPETGKKFDEKYY